MLNQNDYQRNSAAYQNLKGAIASNYPKGWLIGIGNEEIIAAAANFSALQTELRARGVDPRNVLVVEAGVDYPEFVNILL
ncbi:MAG TPA: hypothetical protein VE988_03980 [Gemmataceae bacterium]|nr:hypothetical protein [Gemmataceae bacterium]